MSEADVRELNPAEAAVLLDRDPRAALIDVRSRVEFDFVGHPVGALHVPWKEFPD
jgi:rhodanese-related sulfurtransferase